LNQRASCPNFFDCNGDSIMSIDDVLCCAWKILRITPDSTGGTPPRVDPAVEVRVGLPAAVEGGEVRVPIHIASADHVGAARLAMRFPTDRWSLAGLDADDHAWLTLAGVERGEVVMGVIRTGPEVGPSELNLTLRLRPLGGAPAGGE